MSEPSLFHRADAMISESRFAGTSTDLHWRVSRDLYDEAREHVRRNGMGWIEPDVARLYGLPLDVDEALPSRSLILEPFLLPRLCQRRTCDHSESEHPVGACDWPSCPCPQYLDPDHDDEPEARR